MLQYRIPGKQIVKVTGEFLETPSDEFVVTDFQGEKKWYFHSSTGNEHLYYSSNKPVVVTKEEYLSRAESLIRLMQNEELQKVVLSRVISKIQKLDVEHQFEVLANKYPNAFVYLISSPKFGTWIGATPEILLQKVGDKYLTMSLAGTRKTNDSIPWSEKEYEEQKIVSDYIVSKIEPHAKATVKPLVEHIAGPVKHLKNEIEFEAKKPLTEIADLLHPTPAIGGVPQDKALQLINKVEGDNRGLYTGYVGSLQNDASLFVNLRCMQVFEDEVFVYVGGGLTKDSIPVSEWEETENKAKTLLDTL